MRPGSRRRHYADPRCEVIECALSSVEGIEVAAREVAAIVYCAGSVRGRNLDDFMPANVHGVSGIMRAQASSAPMAPLLLISSLAASRPEISDYARSKYLGEEVLRNQGTVPWTILRPPAVYGPGDREMAPILKMARRGVAFRLGPPNQRFSLLFADDLANAVLTWLTSWRACVGRTFAIDDGCEGGYDWPAIARAAGNSRSRIVGIPMALLAGAARLNLFISRLVGYAPMLTPGKARELTQADWLCDNTTFIQATGWRPQTDFAKGIRLSLDEVG